MFERSDQKALALSAPVPCFVPSTCLVTRLVTLCRRVSLLSINCVRLRATVSRGWSQLGESGIGQSLVGRIDAGAI